ncbi:MAG: hypothetical protein M0005_13165 [Actinomycetota bacterium]|nr:hypothetical protein [Actinomycetota bacterium]
MNWASVIVDVPGALVIAGCLAAWVPDSFWRHLFFAGHPAPHDGRAPRAGGGPRGTGACPPPHGTAGMGRPGA